MGSDNDGGTRVAARARFWGGGGLAWGRCTEAYIGVWEEY
jgi:hypothetical protein